MSRVANNPVTVPAAVEVTTSASEILVKGPLGVLKQTLGPDVAIEREGDTLRFKVVKESLHAIAMSGTLRALTANMVRGVTEGFVKKLTLVGVGYRAQASGDTLNLSLGFSHPIAYKVPNGIKIETPSQTEIIIKGIDKQRVGQTAAEVRAYRKPEPYKGKGVRYADEVVALKETKKK
ncbi:MAG: 50S ribosomal protein L6 [Burkholderiales bacterium]|nr:50S ribosomal protein L6 [Burkholderiales bacterium]